MKQFQSEEFAEDTPLLIQNNGPEIVTTNFWNTVTAKKGFLFLSINANAARLLIPDEWKKDVTDMATGHVVIVSQPKVKGRFATEVLFEDRSDQPYATHLCEYQIDRKMPLDVQPSEGTFIVYVNENGVTKEAFRRPAIFQTVPHLPWLKSLDNEHWAKFRRKTLGGR